MSAGVTPTRFPRLPPPRQNNRPGSSREAGAVKVVVEGGFEPPKDGVQLIYSQSRLATSLFHQRERAR